MNAKQAMRAALDAANKRLKELEYYNACSSADIKDYNKVIDHMIAGGNPCEYCQDVEECQLEAKGRGCDQWMLRDQPKEVIDHALESDGVRKSQCGETGTISGIG